MSFDIPIKDFVLLYSKSNKFNFNNSYILYEINPYVRLFFKKNFSEAYYVISKYNDTLFIHFKNGFFPLFEYNDKNFKIFTLDYSNLFKVDIPLTVNEVAIKEFVLYHTSLHERTFHKEVKRVFGVDSIVINKNSISINYSNESYLYKSLKDHFIYNINKWTESKKNTKHAVFLSGGGESRINTAISHAHGINKTFITWGNPNDKEYLISKKIAKKLETPIQNIRLDCSLLPYREFLIKSGFLTNMVSAYRYEVIKQLFSNLDFEFVWTGLADINGFPVRYQSSELFSDYYLGLYDGEYRYQKGWNREWLKDYEKQGNEIAERVRASPSNRTFFDLKRELFAPRIFGQILAVENTLGTVIAPWFSPEIYAAVHQEELGNPKIIKSKYYRTLWKNELYYQIIKQYCPSLNYIKNSKGYYPWMVQKKFGPVGLAFAALLKKWSDRKKYPFDPVEDRSFIKSELEKIVDEGGVWFNRKEILKIIERVNNWTGPEILENFKLIQIHWFLERNSSKG